MKPLPSSELPPLGERFEIKEETRFCVYRVGMVEPIAVAKTLVSAEECRDMCERDEWPWYSRPKSLKATATPPDSTPVTTDQSPADAGRMSDPTDTECKE